MAAKAAAMANILSTGLTVGVLTALEGLGAGEPDAMGAEAGAADADLELAAAAPTPGLDCPGFGAESLTVLAADGLLGKLIRTVSFLACGFGASAGLGEFSSAIII